MLIFIVWKWLTQDSWFGDSLGVAFPIGHCQAGFEEVWLVAISHIGAQWSTSSYLMSNPLLGQ